MGCFPLPDIVAVDPDMFKTHFPEWREYCRRNSETAGALTRKESGYLVELAQEVRRCSVRATVLGGKETRVRCAHP